MDTLDNFLIRQKFREQTGWSIGFIDRHLPRVKIGRKIVIPVAALERALSGEGRTDAAA